jgi:Spy/CpxP family protein refolding chaperone
MSDAAGPNRRKMKRSAILLTITLAIASAIGVAQSQNSIPNPPSAAERVQHRVQMLTAKLSLTVEQQQQATTIFTNSFSTTQPLVENMAQVNQSLASAVKSNDAAGIEQASTTVGKLTTQITAAEAKADAAFYQILTPEQRARMDQPATPPAPRMGQGFGAAPPIPPPFGPR